VAREPGRWHLGPVPAEAVDGASSAVLAMAERNGMEVRPPALAACPPRHSRGSPVKALATWRPATTR